jgi:hypothetical protein
MARFLPFAHTDTDSHREGRFAAQKTTIQIRTISLMILLLLTAGTLFSQTTSRGTVVGTVADQSGAMVSNAAVTLLEKATNVKRETTSNQDGLYRFDSVLLGDYTVSVQASGFAEDKADITVTSTGVTPRDFHLKVGTSTTEVTVEGGSSAVQLQTEDAVRGGSIDSRNLANLPIVGQNSLNLMLILPGVVKSNLSGSLDSGIGSVNGSRARSNNFMIDGGNNNESPLQARPSRLQITTPSRKSQCRPQTSVLSSAVPVVQ